MTPAQRFVCYSMIMTFFGAIPVGMVFGPDGFMCMFAASSMLVGLFICLMIGQLGL